MAVELWLKFMLMRHSMTQKTNHPLEYRTPMLVQMLAKHFDMRRQ